MVKKYLVHPGWVTSSSDGERHWIGFPYLCRLYQVRPELCVNAETLHSGREYSYWSEKLISLSPLPAGNYVEVRKTKEALYERET